MKTGLLGCGESVSMNKDVANLSPNRYNTKIRWMSYWYQIHEVIESGCQDLLEIGCGNKTVSEYLRLRGMNVCTVDVEPDLQPDYVSNIIELNKIFEPNSFDTVLCCEVLEHLPFQEFNQALDEIYAVCRNYAVISLPYSPVRAAISFELIMPKIGTRKFRFDKALPFLPKGNIAEGHFWEIGRKGYPMKRIVESMTRKFNIAKHYVVQENPWHVFFVLKKGT